MRPSSNKDTIYSSTRIWSSNQAPRSKICLLDACAQPSFLSNAMERSNTFSLVASSTVIASSTLVYPSLMLLNLINLWETVGNTSPRSLKATTSPQRCLATGKMKLCSLSWLTRNSTLNPRPWIWDLWTLWRMNSLTLMRWSLPTKNYRLSTRLTASTSNAPVLSLPRIRLLSCAVGVLMAWKNRFLDSSYSSMFLRKRATSGNWPSTPPRMSMSSDASQPFLSANSTTCSVLVTPSYVLKILLMKWISNLYLSTPSRSASAASTSSTSSTTYYLPLMKKKPKLNESSSFANVCF